MWMQRILRLEWRNFYWWWCWWSVGFPNTLHQHSTSPFAKSKKNKLLGLHLRHLCRVCIITLMLMIISSGGKVRWPVWAVVWVCRPVHLPELSLPRCCSCHPALHTRITLFHIVSAHVSWLPFWLAHSTENSTEKVNLASLNVRTPLEIVSGCAGRCWSTVVGVRWAAR